MSITAPQHGTPLGCVSGFILSDNWGAAVRTGAGNPEAQVGSTDPSSLIEQADPQQVIALLRSLSAEINRLVESAIGCDGNVAFRCVPSVGEYVDLSVPAGLCADGDAVGDGRAVRRADNCVARRKKKLDAAIAFRGMAPGLLRISHARREMNRLRIRSIGELAPPVSPAVSRPDPLFPAF